MKFISKKYKNIILFFVILTLACLISKDSIVKTIKNLFKKIKGCFESFQCTDNNNLISTNPGKKNTPTVFYNSQKDFGYHSENLKSSEAEELYMFLQKMVTPNHNQYDLTSSSTKKFRSNPEGEEILLRFLNQKMNKKVINIKLEDKIYYFKNQVCLDIQPIQISGDYVVNNKNYGKVKIQIELTFRFDQPNDIFMSQTVFNKYSGIFKINRAVLINHDTKVEEKPKKNLPVQIQEPLTYSNFNSRYNFNICFISKRVLN